MPVLSDYHAFDGLHWETGSVRNYFDYRGVRAPHTGEAISEALLLGVSGGAVMGYFPFAYKGYDPMVRILTRNTFDPLDTLLARLGVIQDRRHTTSPERAQRNLLASLEAGEPTIVWADAFSLPYNIMAEDSDLYAMFPLVVFGHVAGIVHIADRARVPLTVDADEFLAARGRVKKVKHRLLTLDPPQWEKLPAAVLAGIWDSIKLFTEKPPKGAQHNFGLSAYEYWIKLLTHPKDRASWAKSYEPGRPLYAVLTTIYEDVRLFGKDGNADRLLFAQFLDEAAVILQKPALPEVAEQFRRSGAAWDALAAAVFPADVPVLNETRELMWQSHQLFLYEGGESVTKRQAISRRLREIKVEMEGGFPLDATGVSKLFQSLAHHVNGILALETQAVAQLRQIVAL